MFKSMKWKLVIIFVLLAVSLLIIVGTSLFSGITSFYHEDFHKEMNTVFGGELGVQLNETITKGEDISAIKDVLTVFSGALGIDTYRNYYILDKNGNFIDGSDPNGKSFTEKSDNIVSAMTGRLGEAVKRQAPYMDYAVPYRGDNGSYIIYIKESKNEVYDVIFNMFQIILQTLLITILICIIFAVFISQTITRPIASLTNNAHKLAKGNFDEKIEVKSIDEIGDLTISFNNMASALKTTLDEIAGEKDKFENILQTMTDGVIAFNSDGRVIHSNLTSREIFGIDNLEAETFESVFGRFNLGISIGDLIYLKGKKTVEEDFYLNGRYIKAFFSAFTLEKGNFGGVTVVLQDNTNQKKLDNERKEFVANVSHELRTPITTVKSYSETLIDGGITDKQTVNSFLQVINSEADRMTRLVKDLLDLSRLDYNKVDWKKTELYLDKLASSITQKLQMEAQAHNQKLTFRKMTDIPAIFADSDRIEQVITNVITNSIKYTPGGGEIFVYCGCVYDTVYLKVKDTGIGIPKKDLGRIFERFYRVDKARSRENGGTGLGLAIAKEIVDAHNGTIKINSEVGKGTEVIINFPVMK